MQVLSLTEFRDYCCSVQKPNYLFELKKQSGSDLPIWFAARYSSIEFVLDSNIIVFSGKNTFLYLYSVQYIELDELTQGYYQKARVICSNPDDGGLIKYDIMITI